MDESKRGFLGKEMGPESDSSMTVKAYADALTKLLPAQFEQLVFFSEVDRSSIPGPSAPLRSRVEAFVRVYALAYGGNMRGLKELSTQVRGPSLDGLADRIDADKIGSEKKVDTSYGREPALSDAAQAYADALTKLLPAQFEQLVFFSEVDRSSIPGPSAPLRSRVEAFVRVYALAYGGNMRGLKELSTQVRGPSLDGLADRVTD